MALAAVCVPPASAAAEKHCGNMGAAAPDYYDVRARTTTCIAARAVVRSWIRHGCGVFERCTARTYYTCHGRRSARRIGGTSTFLINCRTGERTVRWWIVPFD